MESVSFRFWDLSGGLVLCQGFCDEICGFCVKMVGKITRNWEFPTLSSNNKKGSLTLQSHSSQNQHFLYKKNLHSYKFLKHIFTLCFYGLWCKSVHKYHKFVIHDIQNWYQQRIIQRTSNNSTNTLFFMDFYF